MRTATGPSAAGLHDPTHVQFQSTEFPTQQSRHAELWSTGTRSLDLSSATRTRFPLPRCTPVAASHCVPHTASRWHDFARRWPMHVFDTRLRTQWHDSDQAVPSDRATAQTTEFPTQQSRHAELWSTGTRSLDLSSAERGHAFHCRDAARRLPLHTACPIQRRVGTTSLGDGLCTYLTRVSARSGTTLTRQFPVIVPLLKPPSFQPSNLDTQNFGPLEPDLST